MEYVLIITLSYLLGSINPAYLGTKRYKKVDIREMYSNNAGASNMAIAFGFKIGILVGVFDILKGVIPVVILRFIYPDNDFMWTLGGFSAIIGHIYPVFLKFKGGKGTATFGGVLIGLNPIYAFTLAAIFFLILFIFDYIVLSVFFVTTVSPFVLYFLGISSESVILLTVFTFISMWKHRENYLRLYKKEEVGIKRVIKHHKEKSEL